MNGVKHLPYLPGLDGLRALAVMAVVLFHSGQTWLPGGFLGVEVFLVISGYIITSGLLAEWQETGRVRVVGFWGRRARRLLPALFTLLLVMLLGALVIGPAEVHQLRSDSLAAFFYVTNWELIFGHRDYFESFGRPPLLQHLWSLAVEEQFYIVWPLVFAVLVRFLRPRLAAMAILAGAAASACLMAVLYRDVYDASRIYYGTDTRAAGLLLGAGLAFVIRPGFDVRPAAKTGANLLGLAGLAGLAVLAVIALRLGQYEPMLYQGGFATTGLATAAVIVAVARPDAIGSRIIGVAPLRWLGQRSYGIYLWHWPILLLTEPSDAAAWWSLPARLAVVLVVSEVSYRLIETPARRGALSRIWAAVMASSPDTWGYRRAFGALSAVVALVIGGVSVAALNVPAAGASHSTSVEQPLVYDITSDDPALLAEEWAPLPSATPEPAPAPAPEAPPPPPPPRPLPAVGTAPMPAGVNVTAIGDSVLLGAERQLIYVIGAIEVDADIGRQVWSGLALLRERAEADRLGDVLVISFGSNGVFTAKEFDQMMDILADVKLVVFVNVRVPKPWEEANNNVIAKGVAANRNAVLVDWYSATEGHPELFSADGVHLTGSGVRYYAGMIADSIIANWK